MMSSAWKLGRAFARNYSSHAHHNTEASAKLWKNISFFVALPALLLGMVNVYLREQEEHQHEEQHEVIHYPYLKILNKKYPFGDGKHTLFFNEKVNHLPPDY